MAKSAETFTQYHRVFVVTHSFQGEVKAQDLGRVEIIDTIRLAPLVLDAGLSVWLLEKGVVDQQARRSSHDTENRVR